ncbi:MAG: hypothetical protein MZW92_24685 [Comamonadaceae bacterium]|nr:hypothetical protein [Comamonadaceae bacterium]
MRERAAAGRPPGALRRRGVRRAAAGDAGGRGAAGADAAAAQPDARPVPARAARGLRHLLGRRHRTGAPARPLEAALERADEALYEAKRSGKNRTCIG